jgi:gas vesicle protein
LSKQRGKDWLIGAAVGSLIGSIAALLLAPKSGKELRADIANQAQRIGEKAQDVAGTLSEKTQHLAQSVGKHSSEWAGKVKEAARCLVKGKEEEASEGTAQETASVTAVKLDDREKSAS